jgi:N-acyl-D-amino-acid deacylase
MKLLHLFAALSLVVLGQDYDVVIRGGRLIDGTGNPSILADVAIQDGKIAPDRQFRRGEGQARDRRQGFGS